MKLHEMTGLAREISAILVVFGAISSGVVSAQTPPPPRDSATQLEQIPVTATRLPYVPQSMDFEREKTFEDFSRAWDTFIPPVPYEPLPNENQKEVPDEQCTGNPIGLISGTKIESFVDFSGTGEMPLGITRRYSSGFDVASHTDLFGVGWTSNLEHTIVRSQGGGSCSVTMLSGDECTGNSDPDRVSLRTEFGKVYTFQRSSVDGKFYMPDMDDLWMERSRPSPSSPYKYYFRRIDGESIEFRSDGRVEKIVDKNGVYWNYSYVQSIETKEEVGQTTKIIVNRLGVGGLTSCDGQIDCVELRISKLVGEYGARRVTSVRNQDGQVFYYDYSSAQRLTNVRAPFLELENIEYKYLPDYPYSLKEILYGGSPFLHVEYNLDETDTFWYGRATASYHDEGVVGPGYGLGGNANIGVDRVDLHWTNCHDGQVCGNSPAWAYTSIEERSEYGGTTTYRAEPKGPNVYAVNKIVSANRPASAGCPVLSAQINEYDTNGLLDYSIAWDGTKTDYTYLSDRTLQSVVTGIREQGSPSGLAKVFNVWDPLTNVIKSTSYSEFDAATGQFRLVRRTTYDYGVSTTATSSVFGAIKNRISRITTESFVGSNTVETRVVSYGYKIHAGTVVPAEMYVDGPIAGEGDRVFTRYTTKGFVSEVRNSLGHRVQYQQHTNSGLARRIIDENQEIVDLTYDARGRVKTETRYIGGAARGKVYTYDRKGNVASVSEAGYAPRYFTYDTANRLKRAWTLEEGDFVTQTVTRYSDYVYKTGVNVRKHSKPEQVISGINRNGCDEPQYSTYFEYDEFGLLTKKFEADRILVSGGACPVYSFSKSDRFEQFEYDELGRVEMHRIPSGKVENYSYDGLGRIKDHWNFEGVRTNYAYFFGSSPVSAAVSVTPAYGLGVHGATVSYTNGFGDLVSESSPSTGTTGYSYFAGGLINTISHADGSSISFAYDSLGRVRLKSTTPPTSANMLGVSADSALAAQMSSRLRNPTMGSDSGPTTSTLNPNEEVFVYDSCPGMTPSKSIGRLCSATHGSAYWVTSYRYGDYGRLLEQRENGEDQAFGTIVSYRYDGFGRPAGIDYPSGRKSFLSYNTAGVLSEIRTGTSTPTNVAADLIQFDSLGNVASFRNASGASRVIARDASGRTSSISTGGVQSLGYGYTVEGYVDYVTNTIDPSGSQDYGYDDQGRVTSSIRSGTSEVWTYSAAGDRKTYSVGGANFTYQLNGTRLDGYYGTRGRSYINDARGQREVQYDGNAWTRYIYDTTGAIRWLFRPYSIGQVCEPMAGTASTGPNCAFRGESIRGYGTNYLGQRIFDAYWHSGSLNESCSSVYDPNCLPTLTYADTLYQFAYAPNGNLLFENTRPYTNVGSANWWYGSQTHFSDYIWLGGEPVAVWRDGSMYAISNDHLGRPEVVTNTAGSVVWRARNLAYHREQTVNNSGFGSLGLSFPGQYLDAESGMAYNWHRVYDPSSGRYTQSDPIGLAGGVNTFAYVGGNPVNSVDPFGLCEEKNPCPQANPGSMGTKTQGMAVFTQPGWKTISAYNSGNTSLAEARQKFAPSELWNGRGDAWRHFRWNFAMTQSIGSKSATVFANAYEVSHPNVAAEHAMDMYNNAMGRAFASDPRYQNLSPSAAANLALLLNCLQTSK